MLYSTLFPARFRFLARHISRRIALTPLALASTFWLTQPASSQIVTDGTLGAASTRIGPHYNIPAALGQKFGPNLFHSFSDFNIYSGESATFSGPSSVQNILSRVTGGQSSIIDGQLNSTIAGANFFFVNPAGVIFGPDAQINVSGDFTATTADAMRLGSNGVFHAQNPSASVLSSAPPAAFGFLTPNPKPIQILGSRLVTQPGRALSLIGGGISVEGAIVAAPSGKVNLVSVGSAGEVKLNGSSASAPIDVTSFEKLGDIILRDGARVVVTESGGIRVRAENLYLTGNTTRIGHENVDAAQNAGVDIGLRGTLLLSNGAAIQSFASGTGRGASIIIEADRILMNTNSGVLSLAEASGPGGNITVRANFVEIDGRGSTADEQTGIGAFTTSGSTGQGGNIEIEALGLVVFDKALISANTLGAGNSGNVSISTGDIVLDGNNALDSSRISSDTAAPSGGDGGKVEINAGHLQVINGAAISSSTIGDGQGGSVLINANSVTLDAGAVAPSSIAAIAAASGNSGSIEINAGALNVLGASTIASNTNGSGHGGKINIAADSIVLDGRDIAGANGIGAESRDASGGNGGGIEINARSLILKRGAGISASTFGSGNGGSITLDVDSIDIQGKKNTSTLMAVASSTGNGGTVTIKSQKLRVTENARIIATTAGAGSGGTIQIDAKDIVLEGRNSLTNGIISESRAANGGNSGQIEITTESLKVLQGAAISTSTVGTGQGADIVVKAKSIVLDGDVQNTGLYALTLGKGNGGNVVIKTDEMKVLENSLILTGTEGTGNGGNVHIIAKDMLMDGRNTLNGNGISSDSLNRGDGGNSGNIKIEAGSFKMINNVGISTGTDGNGQGGNIHIRADSVMLDSGGTGAKLRARTISNHEKAGNGGNIKVEARDIQLLGDSGISTSTTGRGNGGKIEIKAEHVRLDGRNSDNNGISSDSLSASGGQSGSIRIKADKFVAMRGSNISTSTVGTGQGGDVEVSANEARLETGAVILAATLGTGNGGNVKVTADSLTIDGSGEVTGILADTVAADTEKGGTGGSIQIKAGNFLLQNKGTISTSSHGSGDGGRIEIEADTASLRAGNILATSEKMASAGNIQVQTNGGLELSDGSNITTEARQANGGNISLRAGGTIRLNDSAVSASAVGDGGNIQLRVGGGVRLQRSLIAAFAGESGGDIDIQPFGLTSPRFVTLDRSAILASAVNGNGGNIKIQANVFLPSFESIIDASSQFGVAGNIAIESPNTNMGGSLVTLPSNPLDAESYLAERCVVQQTGQSSSFSVDTRRAMPAQPGDLLPSSDTE